MILFHGTNTDIDHIDLSRSKVGKDFGVGFYLTPDYETAVRQAYRRTDIEGGTPVVVSYNFDLPATNTLNTTKFDGYSREWAEFVKMNRDNRSRSQVHPYDIVIGPIANDDIGMQMRKFKAGQINMDQFLEAIKYKQVTMQYFFGTQPAVNLLSKLECKVV